MPLKALIEAIHASPVRFSLCVCGAGTGAVARLTQVKECSHTLIEAQVLYHRTSTRIALDGLPKRFVSVEAARRLAQHAFHVSRNVALAEARETSPVNRKGRDASFLFGVGATSAIQTSRARRSGDQVFVSVWGGAVHPQKLDPLILTPDAVEEVGSVIDYHLDLPNMMGREEQERQVELLVLNAVAEAVERCGTPTDTQHVQFSGGHAYPTSLFRSLLPLPSSGATATTTTTPLNSSAESGERLFNTPSRSAPHHVSLNTAHEVSAAIQSVLSCQPAPGQPEDVCVLWNKHGELRRAGLPPYDEEWCNSEVNTPTSNSPSSPSAPEVPQPLRLLYPGSYNPLHYGHTELVQAATRVLRQQPKYRYDPHTPVQVTYEIAVKVVGKGAVTCDELQRRVAQFLERGERVAVTNTMLFTSKARLFPGHGFLIGIDTAMRVVDPQYYSSSTDPQEAEAAMVAALQRDIGDRGCYFVVGGRKLSDAVGWQDLSSLSIPPAIQHLFVGIPEVEFHVDISSTELRARKWARLDA